MEGAAATSRVVMGLVERSCYDWVPGNVWRISLWLLLVVRMWWYSLSSLSRVLFFVYSSSACFLFASQLHRFIARFIFAQPLHCFQFICTAALLLFSSFLFYFISLLATRKPAFGLFPFSVPRDHWRSCPIFCFCANYLPSQGSVVPSSCSSCSSLVYHTTSSIVSILRGGGGDFPT